MAHKKIMLGMLAGLLAFGMAVVGCDDSLTDDYTFEFKVQNIVGIGAISKIEFINGSNESAKILQTQTVNLTEGQMSGAYKVSGFSEKEKDNYHIFGIKITTANGNTHFDWSSATNKIKVEVSAPFWVMTFSGGNW